MTCVHLSKKIGQHWKTLYRCKYYYSLSATLALQTRPPVSEGKKSKKGVTLI